TTGLKSISQASNDAGAGIINDLIGTLFDDYDYTSSSGMRQVAFGEKVRVDGSDYTEADTPFELLNGKTVTFDGDGTYQYMGEDVISSTQMDLRALFDPFSPEWVKLSGDSGRLYEYQGSINFDYTTVSAS